MEKNAFYIKRKPKPIWNTSKRSTPVFTVLRPASCSGWSTGSASRSASNTATSFSAFFFPSASIWQAEPDGGFIRIEDP